MKACDMFKILGYERHDRVDSRKEIRYREGEPYDYKEIVIDQKDGSFRCFWYDGDYHPENINSDELAAIIQQRKELGF